MEILHSLTQNLFTPAVLFFILGIGAGFFKSDLEIPKSISSYLSIYLMMAIGFKGGVAIAAAPEFSQEILLVIAAAIAIGVSLPLLAFTLLRRTTKLDTATAAAVAAHYGSISIVTFATAAAFLKLNGIEYEGYIVAIAAIKEAPAILVGLYLAHKYMPETRTHQAEEKKLSREIFTNGAIMLLLGSFIIGWMTGDEGMAKMEGFLVTPFQGILALFLLDMGLMVAKNMHHLRSFTLSLAAFGIYMPLIGAGIGLGAASVIGLDVGTGFLFTVLCASASYIAVPAAMKLALPEAKASIYVPLSLAVTFPFNILIGIPLYDAMAIMILGQ
jgi:hypothetical protein